MTDIPPLLSSTDVCNRLGIGRSTLSQWMAKGWIIPAQQLANGLYLFTEAEVERASAAEADVERARIARAEAASA